MSIVDETLISENDFYLNGDRNIDMFNDNISSPNQNYNDNVWTSTVVPPFFAPRNNGDGELDPPVGGITRSTFLGESLAIIIIFSLVYSLYLFIKTKKMKTHVSRKITVLLFLIGLGLPVFGQDDHVTTPVAAKYIAPAGETVRLEVKTIQNGKDVTDKMKYLWYENKDDIVPILNVWNTHVLSVKKDSESVQEYWVQPKKNSTNHGGRIKVSLHLAEICGERQPVDCSIYGRLLFKEDFGGNNVSDPRFKSSGIAGVSYSYNRKGIPANADLPYLNENQYFITKVGEPHRESSDKRTANPSLAGGDWACISDHTYPNDYSRGYFLEANANDDKGQFFYYELSDLCPGTTVLFTAWIANVLGLNSSLNDHVNQIFRLETKAGKILVQYDTGNILNRTDNDWKQYGFEFIVPENESTLVLRILDDGSGSRGNDFGLDDIEIHYCSKQKIQYLNKTVFDNMLCEKTPIIARCSTEASESLYYKYLYRATATENWTIVEGGGPFYVPTEISHLPERNGYYCIYINNSSDFVKDCSYLISEPIHYRYICNPEDMYWSRNAEDDRWNNINNWEYADGRPYGEYPTECSDVYIPGCAKIYPWLEEEQEPKCRDIYFHFGGEVAQPQLLTYRRAQVQYNLGTYDKEEGDENRNLGDFETDNDDDLASFALNRYQWYAFAAPLKGMVSGDFSVGGYPNIWQRSFKSSPHEKGMCEGDWADPNNSIAWNIEEQHNAIAIRAAHYEEGRLGYDNQSYLEDLDGVLYMPFFHENDPSKRNRTYSYDHDTKENKFYYYYYNEQGLPIAYNKYETIVRGEECFRFVFEDENKKPLDEYRMKIPAGSYAMVGNPFLSSLDFITFYYDNKDVLNTDIYMLANADDFLKYSMSTGSADRLKYYIAPLQAFHIHTVGEEGDPDVEIVFKYEQSMTRPESDPHSFRTQGVDNLRENVVYLEVSDSYSKSSLSLSYQDLENNNTPGLKMKSSKTPFIYSLDENNSINVVQFEKSDEQKAVQVGVLYDYDDELTIKLQGKQLLKAESVYLFDKQTGESVDLMLEDYSFTMLPNQGERFEIVYIKDGTAIKNFESSVSVKILNNKLVVNSDAHDLIDKVEVFDLQGRMIFAQNNINHHFAEYEITDKYNVVIVKVSTKKKRVVKKLRMQ